MSRQRVVVALGGNALLRSGERPTVEHQARNVERAVAALAPLAEAHDLLLTHGNGPQIGLLSAGHGDSRYPLDVVGAETEGMIGYLLERQLRNALPDRRLVTLLTQVEVDGDDAAFHEPTKPVGRPLPREEAERLSDELGWAFKAVDGGFRRVVPSPEPLRIVQLEVLRLLVEAGVTAICAGGGGIPMVRRADGTLQGVQAVIDKDLISALLAGSLDAGMLLLLTDVDAVYENWRQPDERRIGRIAPDALADMDFETGSMAPKVHAAVAFVRATGRPAAIGRLEDATSIVSGARGTHVTVTGSVPVAEPPAR